MTDDSERNDWTDLVQSAGFQRLVQLAQKEWNGPAFVSLVDQLVDRADDMGALSRLRQMMAAKRAVERLLNLPRERLAQLDRREDAVKEPGQGRRGPL